jgi:hypothetical protein
VLEYDESLDNWAKAPSAFALVVMLFEGGYFAQPVMPAATVLEMTVRGTCSAVGDDNDWLASINLSSEAASPFTIPFQRGLK